MKNLIDTHAFIWFINGDEELSKSAKNVICDSKSTNYISIASLWEISIKISIGKLKLSSPFAEISNQIIQNGSEILPISFEDTLLISKMPFHHRDPFD